MSYGFLRIAAVLSLSIAMPGWAAEQENAAAVAPVVADDVANRVRYVPEIVKEEIREEVKRQLKAEVVEEVKAQAMKEGWGVPAGLPEWMRQIKWSGDVRLRGDSEMYSDGNLPCTYIDFNNLSCRNVTVDRSRLRLRGRLGIEAQPAPNITTGLRLSTGSTGNPVSNNITLGNYNQDIGIVLDRAYLRYTTTSKRIAVTGGRMANPFFYTDLTWDPDVDFDGVSASIWPLGASSNAHGWRPYLTAGAFPIQEVALSSDDKWLLGSQAGMEWGWGKKSLFRLGLAYYDLNNVTGRTNPIGSFENDYTAPEFYQNGNTLFDIDPTTDAFFALAAEYREVNVTASLDLGNFDPVHVILTTDYVRNIGYDKKAVDLRLFEPQDAEVDGYQVGLLVGWPELVKQGSWNTSLTYRYLEKDAVIDGFADSDFHLGGTDAKGVILSAGYGLARNTWLALRMANSNEVSKFSPEVGVDRVFVDFNTKF